jgi:tape measure domain-containing protein
MAGNSEGKSYYGLVLDNGQLRKDAQQASGILKGIGNSAEAEGARIDNMYKKIVGFGSGFLVLQHAKEFISQIVKVRGEVESLSISFETLLGSKQKADALFSQIKDFAAKTPLELTPLAKGAQLLLSFNVEAEKVMPILKQIGDISMGSADKFNSLTLAFSQMYSAGKLMGQDLIQMINAGFNPLSVMSEKTGKSIAVLKDEMSAGAISADMVADAFRAATEEGGKFNGMLEKQSKGIEGSLSNLSGAIDDMMNDLGTKGQGLITSSIAGATAIVENYEKIGKAIMDIVVAYGAYKAALITLNAIQNLNRKILMQAVLEKKLAAAAGIQLSNAEAVAAARTKLLSLAQHGLVKALKAAKAAMLSNPYTWFAVAVAALAYGIYKLITAETAAEAAQRKHNEAMEAAKERKDSLVSKTQQLINKIDSETLSIRAQIKAWQKLKEEMPEAFGKMTIDEIKAMKPEDREKLINKTVEDREDAEIDNAYYEALRKVIKLEEKLASDNRVSTNPYGTTNLSATTQSQLAEAREWLKLKKQEKEANDEIIRQADFMAQSVDARKDIIQKEIEELQAERAGIEAAIDKSKKVTGEWKPYDVQPLVDEGRVELINREIERRNVLLKELNKQSKDAVQNKAHWEKQEKEAKNALEAMGESAKGNADWNKEMAKLREAQKNLKTWDFSDKQANSQKLAANERNEKIQEYYKKLSLQVKESEKELTQSEIDAMQEGLEKEVAQINFNYNKLIEENDRRRDEWVKELQEKERIEWENEHPNYKEKGEVFTPTSTKADLSKEQIDALKNYEIAAANEKKTATVNAENEAFTEIQEIRKELYNDLRDGLQKEIISINDHYDKLVEKAKKAGADIVEIEEINRQRKNSIDHAELNDESERINEELKLREDAIESEERFLEDRTGKEMKLIKVRKEAAEKQLQLLKQQQALGKQGLDGQIKQAEVTIKKFNGQLAKLKYEKVNAIASSFKDITDALKDSNSEIGEMASGIGNLLDTVNSVMQGFASGGPVGGVLAMVGSAVSTILSALQESGDSGENSTDLQIENIKRMGELVDKQISLMDDLFGTERIEQFNIALNSLNSNIQNNLEELNRLSNWFYLDGEYHPIAGAGQEHTQTWEMLEPVLIRIRELSRKKSLTAEDINELNELNNTVQSFSRDYNMGIEGRDWLAEAKQYTDSVVNYIIDKNELVNKEILSDIDTNISSLTDSITEMFRSRTDSAEDFAKSFDELMSDAITNIFKRNIIEEEMRQVYDVMRDSMMDDRLISPEELERIRDSYSEATSRIKEQWDAMEATFKEGGLDLSSGAEREASQKGFASMSQDSANELNGRFTAMQALTASIVESMKILTANSGQILKHLAGIESNTKYCENLEDIGRNISSMKSGIDDIQLKGITIRT